MIQPTRPTSGLRLLGYFAASAFAGIACGLIGGVILAASALVILAFLGGP